MEAAAGTGLSQEAVAELRHIHGLAEQVKGAVQQLQHTSATSAQQVKEAVGNLQPALGTVKAAVESLETTLKKEGRLQALRWALDHINLVDNFAYSYREQTQYYSSYHDEKRTNSQEFTKGLLLFAMESKGRMFPRPSKPTEQDTAAQAEFRNKIKAEVRRVTGIEPRLVDNGDKGWAIYID